MIIFNDIIGISNTDRQQTQILIWDTRNITDYQQGTKTILLTRLLIVIILHLFLYSTFYIYVLQLRYQSIKFVLKMK